jgi:hypothetical protein
LRDSEAAASMLVRAALTHVRAALNPAPQPARGTPAPPLTTTDTAALAAMTMAFLQISTAFSDGADVLTRGLRARLSAEDADRENEAECA